MLLPRQTFGTKSTAKFLVLLLMSAGGLTTMAAAQNQTLDTSNGQACTTAGGVLSGSNLFTDFDNGTFGTGSGAVNEIPATNPYPAISGGVYQNSYSSFPHGSYTIISNQVNRRNNSQSNGTQIDPVFGTNGRFLVSDPDLTSPTFSAQLANLVNGEAYEVSFWVADSERRDGADKQRMAITLDGNSASPLFTTPFINSGGGDSAATPVVWQKWSFVYTHNSAATTAELGIVAVETGASGRDIFFDNMVVQQCSFDTDLQTEKSLASANSIVDIGETVTFSITVTNNGTSAAQSVSLTDLLPSELTATGNNGGVTQGDYDAVSGVWDVGSLAIGGSATLTLEGTVNAGVAAGSTIRNVTVAASHAANDPATTDDDLEESVQTANPLLQLTKVADDDEFVTVGQLVTYTYRATNNGNVNINNVTIGDVHNGAGPAPTPAGETLTTDNGTTGDSTDVTANDGVWSVLAPGDVVTFTGTYTVQQADIDNLQ